MNKILFVIVISLIVISCNHSHVYFDTASNQLYIDPLQEKKAFISSVNIYSHQKEVCEYAFAYDSLKTSKVDLTSVMNRFECDSVWMLVYTKKAAVSKVIVNKDPIISYCRFIFSKKDKGQIIEATLMHE